MITAHPLPPQPTAASSRWQALWRDAIRDPHELLALLGLPELAARLPRGDGAAFPLRVPRGFVARMPAGRVPQQEVYIEDALLIAVRRSLASCRDSSQRRMLSAFEARR